MTKDEAKEKIINDFCKCRIWCELYPALCQTESCEIWWALKALSSARPEIIRCKDCRKNPNWEWVGCPMTGKDTRKPDDFCSYAERRADE